MSHFITQRSYDSSLDFLPNNLEREPSLPTSAFTTVQCLRVLWGHPQLIRDGDLIVHLAQES